MKVIRRSILGSLLAALMMLCLAPPASAQQPETDYLSELQRIAGESADYQQTPTETDFRVLALDPFQCTLYPSVVHLRTSSGRRSVGAKPYTSCLAGAPSIISQTSTLYIVEFAGVVYKRMTSATATSRGVRSLNQRNVEWFCVNSNSSRFQQETKGYSVQAGRTYQSAVITARVDLACGY